MKKIVLVASLLALSGCVGGVQTGFVTSAPDGSLVYNYTGYTDLGETQPDDSRKYLVKALEFPCGDNGRITRLNEGPAHNGVGDFLVWSGEGKCDKKQGKQ